MPKGSSMPSTASARASPSRRRDRPRLRRAQQLGLPVKLHAEQLSNLGGAKLAASYLALSADHLEYLTAEDAAVMAAAGTVAVLLPGAFYAINEKQKPPVKALRDAGAHIAIATDCNPGTSPLTSLLLTMNMSATLFGLTVEECIAGVTREGARALGLLDETGTLETASPPTSRSGTSRASPSSSTASASTRFMHTSSRAKGSTVDHYPSPWLRIAQGSGNDLLDRRTGRARPLLRRRHMPGLLPASPRSPPATRRSTASTPASGKLASIKIDSADVATLQRNLILSHCCGVGAPLPENIVRLIMALKLVSLGRGASGVRLELVRLIEGMLEKGVIPVIPEKGSVGASGDLAPLAHMAAVMMGEAEAFFAANACRAPERSKRPA
jgi:hypothetical protein